MGNICRRANERGVDRLRREIDPSRLPHAEYGPEDDGRAAQPSAVASETQESSANPQQTIESQDYYPCERLGPAAPSSNLLSSLQTTNTDRLPPKTDPGYGDALYELSLRYFVGNEDLEVDAPKQVFYLLKEAAEIAGHGDSMVRLGYCYKNGYGCEKDPDKASYWEAKSLEQKGNLESMCQLGAYYKNGKGCKQDSGLARECWEKVAQQQGGAGTLHWYGRDEIKRDYSVGYNCLSIASQYGHNDALSVLLYYHQTESGGSLDDKIQKLRATHDKDPSDFVASFLLAECLSNAFKIRDLDEATKLLAQMSHEFPFYARSQWLVPFLREKKNIIFLSGPRQSFPSESDYVDSGHLKIVALIGEGQFGKVYLAKYQAYREESRWVAVKYLNDNEFKEHQDAVNKLMRERLANQILKASNSRNTVDYIGIVTDFKNKKSGLVFEICADLSLVMEDAENRINNDAFVGNLGNRDFDSKPSAGVYNEEERGTLDFDSLPDWRSMVPSSLRSAVVFARACPFRMEQLLKIFVDVASALQCFHVIGLLHRDIADRNVLCDGRGNVQLADFGMSRFLGLGTDFDDQTMLEYCHKLTEGNQYAVAWWPPECLGEEPIFSFASDVYSFFVMVWQCLSGEDPFQSLLIGDGNPYVRVTGAILRGERPDLERLRNDTPDGLRDLIRDSWAADPLRRPALEQVILELEEILDELNQGTENTRCTRRIRGNQVERHWFDVRSMYLEMPAATLIEEAQNACRGSFQASFLQRQVARQLETAASNKILSKETIWSLGGRRPYDVFIVHTGKEKWVEASTLKLMLELAGFRCFLDCCMNDNDGRPVDQMQFALESCRYVVAVISKAFLKKKYPCRELQHAFDRARWLQGLTSTHSPFQSWRSLRIVLLDLSVDEYDFAQSDASRVANDFLPLPPLGREVVVEEFGQRGIEWTTVGEQLGERLLRHDREQGAVDRWSDFLRSWQSLPDQGFPRANRVYYD